MVVRLLETAKADLRAGWKFYEESAAGLGDYFLDCVQADVRSLKIFGGIHEMSDEFHRMLVKRFPFAVYYLIEDEVIDVYAILDCHPVDATTNVPYRRRRWHYGRQSRSYCSSQWKFSAISGHVACNSNHNLDREYLD